MLELTKWHQNRAIFTTTTNILLEENEPLIIPLKFKIAVY